MPSPGQNSQSSAHTENLTGTVERVTFRIVVVIPLAMQHYTLLERNLLYTGVTRGKKLVVIIGQPKALAIAVKKVGSTRRLTNLAARLKFN